MCKVFVRFPNDYTKCQDENLLMSTIQKPVEFLAVFFLLFVFKASEIAAVSKNFTFTGGFLDSNASKVLLNASSV